MENINKKIAIASSKQIQIYELLIKIQNVINTESLLPQFIYFAKSMEEMRKKWLQAEFICKELENKLSVEKSIYQRKINELKIDIEIHHEKRLQAESKAERLQNEMDKLQKQFEMFKEVLGSDKKTSIYNYEPNFLCTYNLNEFNNQQNCANNFEFNQNQNYQTNEHNTPRKSLRGIEDTGSIISDYTEDDIDLPNDDNIISETCNLPNENQTNFASKNFLLNSNLNTKQNNVLSNQPSSTIISLLSLQNQKTKDERKSLENKPKRSQRQSTSLTRNNNNNNNNNNDNEDKENKDSSKKTRRSRTRSNDIVNRQTNQAKNSQTNKNISKRNSNSSITTITTLKIGEDGRPVAVTSEIQHNNPENSKNIQINQHGNKTELTYMPQRVKNRKKRPSREFLRTADESETNEDSEIFWNISSEVLLEDVSTSSQPGANTRHNINIMTPIVETPTPTKTQKSVYKQKQSSNPTPSHKHSASGQYKSTNGLIPLAKKYKRAHVFKAQVILNSELCASCDKRTKFGKMIMKCRECDLIVHTECKDTLQRACYPAVNFPSQGCISDYVNSDDSPRVPSILQMFINEIETRGLLSHEVGLYRVNGSDAQVKQLKEKFFKRHQVPDLRKTNDVHVLCSFVKDFLNNLNEHLITYDSWHRFSKLCEIQNEADRIYELQNAINDLPDANRDTLGYLILHLQRISETAECKMPSSNLARVFGPSIVGNSSPNQSPAEIINELRIQHQIVENLIKVPTSYYFSLIEANNDQQQKLFKNTNKTPELMRKSKTAVVLSSILGPATNIPSAYQNQINKYNKN